MSASPSTGAYLDSAACVNLLPTRVTFHPVHLEQPETDALLRPVHGEVRWLGLVKDADTALDLLDNRLIRLAAPYSAGVSGTVACVQPY